MPIAIQLPALSPTMSEGRITKWLKQEGDAVTSGTAIAECETDKSNLEIEAYDDGVLLKILVKAGDVAPVGSTIAWLGKKGEAIPDAPPPAPVAAAVAAPAAAPAVAAPPPAARPAAPAPPPPPPPPPPAPAGRLRASPLAKKMAAERGLDLQGVQGSGPMGRIVKKDVEAAGQAPASAPVARPVVAVGQRVAPDKLPLTSMRKIIAQRLTEVKPGVPHFYLSVDVEMDEALRLKDEAKAMDLRVSVNDIIVKATALAVRRFPRINQVFAGDHLVQQHNVDVGVAVAIEDGLITPLVRDADLKPLEALGAEIRELAERARRKALKPEEYTGGSITVSNLGMFGIDSFIAVINPPHAAILAVGKVEPKVVVRDGQMVIRQMMTLTLSGDHRVIDGAVGAQFLQVLRPLLERPLRMVL